MIAVVGIDRCRTTALGRMLPLVSSTMSVWMSRFEVSDVEPPNPSCFSSHAGAMPA